MAALEDHLNRPLKDTVGNPIKNGSTVIDLMFGIARGTVRLEKGDGVNVLHCLVRNRSSRQADESGCREPHAQGRRRFPHDFDRDWRRVRVRRCESCTRGVNDAEAVQMRTVRDALLWCIAGCVITGVM